MEGIDSGGFEIKKDEPRWKHMRKTLKELKKQARRYRQHKGDSGPKSTRAVDGRFVPALPAGKSAQGQSLGYELI
jgi:hypothetical protein